MPAITLLERTIELYENRPAKISRQDIAAKIDVPDQWLYLVTTGQIKDPGVNRVEKLYNFLSGL